MDELSSLILFLYFIAFIISLIIYFVPTVVAMHRGHRNKVAIIILNIFVGWSFIGWVVALVWSFTANTVETEGYSSEKVIAPKKDKSSTNKKETKSKESIPHQKSETPSGFINLSPEERRRKDAEALEKLNKS